MTPCNPCGEIDCVIPSDYSLYDLEDCIPGPTTNPFVNETVYFPITPCPPGETLSFSGTLPSWITLDLIGSQFVGSAGTFSAQSTTAATLVAQTAINEFGAAQLAAGTITCQSASLCLDGPGALANNIYAITGYYDGLIPVTEGGAWSPNWTGTFPYYQNSNWSWYASTAADIGIQGFAVCDVRLQLQCSGTDPSWIIKIQGGSDLWWIGTKVGGSTPVGVYNQTGGVDVTPASVTIAQIGGTTSPGGMSCST